MSEACGFLSCEEVRGGFCLFVPGCMCFCAILLDVVHFIIFRINPVTALMGAQCGRRWRRLGLPKLEEIEDSLWVKVEGGDGIKVERAGIQNIDV